MFNYYDKYIKYKAKYLELKNNKIQSGGYKIKDNNKLIIHISGSSGSGKTTLGNKLQEKFGNKIIVKDLDNLRDEHIKKTYDTSKGWSIDEIKYQKFIDDFIDKQNKPIIFVGLNDNRLGIKKIYYNTHSQHNFYIDINDKILLKQKCLRMLTEEIPNDKNAMKDLIENNQTFIKGMKFAIDGACNLEKIIKENNKFKKDYKKQGYTFLSKEDIFKKVSKILKHKL
jgi:adenylate kinase family enzyme